MEAVLVVAVLCISKRMYVLHTPRKLAKNWTLSKWSIKIASTKGACNVLYICVFRCWQIS